MKLFTFRNWFFVVLAFAVGFWAIEYCLQYSLVRYVTFHHGLPRGARVVSVKHPRMAAQDGMSFLIFDAPRAGIESFVEAYCDGLTLDTLPRNPDSIRGYFSTQMSDFPLWHGGAVKNGRFLSRSRTNGFLMIDLDKNRVFINR